MSVHVDCNDTSFPERVLLSLLAGLALAACGKPPSNQAPPAPEVTVQTVGSRPVPSN